MEGPDDRCAAACAECLTVNTLHSPGLSTAKSFCLERKKKNDIISNFTLMPVFPPCLARFTDAFRRAGSLGRALPFSKSQDHAALDGLSQHLQGMVAGPS